MTLRRADAALVLALLALAGCGGASRDDYLQIFRDQKASWDEITAVLETVKDRESMERASKLFDEKAARFEEIARRAKSLPPPSAEARRRLAEEMQVMQRSNDRMREELLRVSRLPGGEEFLNQFRDKANSISAAMP